MTSQARIIANQNNAKRSTGPKSAAGKGRSKMNALKHGLRAEMIVLPTEDPAEFDAMLAEWTDEWKPPTGTRRQLLERAVAAAWRVNRSVRIEKAALADRAEEALFRWDDARAASIEKHVKMLADDPLEAIERLKWTREGIARLVGLWEGVVAALARPGGWHDPREHHVRYLNLRGHAFGDPDAAELDDASWRLLLGNRPDLAAADPDGPLDPSAADRVREVMSRYAKTMIAVLSDEWSATPDDAAARLRAAEAAAYAFRPEDLKMQRYEGRHDREFRANLALLISLTKTGLDLVADEKEEAEVAAVEAEPEAVAPNEAKRKGSSEGGAPNEPNAIGPELTVVQVERDRGGRIWPVAGPLDGPPDGERA